VDGIRLSGRAESLWPALRQLALRRVGYVRLPERYFLLLPIVVGIKAGAASFSALELERQRRPGNRRVVLHEPGQRELFLNGTSLGTKRVERNSHVEWKVKYAPGVLEARGLMDGQVVLTQRRETTGAPARLGLRPDREKISADGVDVAVIGVGSPTRKVVKYQWRQTK
jgi:hypothetical protein